MDEQMLEDKKTEELNKLLDEMLATLRSVQECYVRMNEAFGNFLMESPGTYSRWVSHREKMMEQAAGGENQEKKLPDQEAVSKTPVLENEDRKVRSR